MEKVSTLTLIKILTWYIIIILLISISIITLYINNLDEIILITEDGQIINSIWFSIFSSISAFVNCGFTLINFINLNLNSSLLWIMVILIILSNTAFPVVLRLILRRLLTYHQQQNHHSKVIIYQYILNYSRYIYTHLFSNFHTRMLFISFGMMFFLETLIFLIGESNNQTISSLSLWNFYFLKFFSICIY